MSSPPPACRLRPVSRWMPRCVNPPRSVSSVAGAVLLPILRRKVSLCAASGRAGRAAPLCSWMACRSTIRLGAGWRGANFPGFLWPAPKSCTAGAPAPGATPPWGARSHFSASHRRRAEEARSSPVTAPSARSRVKSQPRSRWPGAGPCGSRLHGWRPTAFSSFHPTSAAQSINDWTRTNALANSPGASRFRPPSRPRSPHVSSRRTEAMAPRFSAIPAGKVSFP